MQSLEALAITGCVLGIQRVTSLLLDGRANPFGQSLPGPTVLLVSAMAVVGICQVVTPAITTVLGERLSGASTAQVLAVAGSIELSGFDEPAVLDRLKRVEVGAMIRPAQLAGGLSMLLSGAVGVAALTVSVLLLQPWLALVAVAAAVPLWWAAKRDGQSQYESVRGLSRLERRRMYLAGLLTRRDHAAEIRALDLTPVLLDRYRELSQRRCAEVKRTALQRARRQLAVRLIGGLLMMAGIAAMLVLLRSGAMGVSDAVAAAAAAAALRGRLVEAAIGIRSVQEAAEFVDDHAAVCDLDTRTDSSPVGPASPLQRLSLRGVTVQYPGMNEPALRDIDLELPVGEVVALVGVNGSGKSTLAAVVAGLLTPNSGTVERNGVDLQDMPTGAWRKEVSVLLQSAGRYQETLRDNIFFGAAHRPVDDAAIYNCVADAGVELPGNSHRRSGAGRDGLDVRLGREQDGAVELSGGQWQRVALARTFYRDARMLILDEPSAALDPMAEADLVRRLRDSFADRAVLLITHRMAAAQMADRIVVLHRGRIIEEGTPEELASSDGAFAGMRRAQESLWRPKADKIPPTRTFAWHAVPQPTR